MGSAGKTPFFNPHGSTNDPLFHHGATYDLIVILVRQVDHV